MATKSEEIKDSLLNFPELVKKIEAYFKKEEPKADELKSDESRRFFYCDCRI